MSEISVSPSAIDETCNSIMDNRNNFRLRKINIFEAPEFTQRLKTFLESETGKSATFVGYYRATPPPTVTWVREDEVLSNSDKHIIATDQTAGCSLLTITHVNRKDEGPYKCRLDNVEGNASSTGYLSVIASKSRRSKKKGGSTTRVSSPPVLKSIQELATVEEKEEQELVNMPPSPLNEFIANIKHNVRSMNTAINYGNPASNDGENQTTDNNNTHTMNGDSHKAVNGLHTTSSPQKGLGTNSVIITTACRQGKTPPGSTTNASERPSSFKQSFHSSSDKLDLYMKTNNLSNLISPKITASRPQHPEAVSTFQQKQLQKLQQIQDFKQQKLQLKLQHKELQEKLKKKEQFFMEKKDKKSGGISPSEQRPLKLRASTPTNLTTSSDSMFQGAHNIQVGVGANSNTVRKRRNSIEIKVVSKGMKDSFMNTSKPLSVKSSLIISTTGVVQKTTTNNIINPNSNINVTSINNVNANSSLLEELKAIWACNPCFYFQLSFVIAVSLAALATNSHPVTVVAVVTLASLLAFSQIPQLLVSFAEEYPSSCNPDVES